MSRTFMGFNPKIVRISVSLLTFAALLLSPLYLQAQLVRGAVSGTAIDPQNAAVPGVQVKLTSRETRGTQVVTTNEVGFYRLAALEPGAYSVEFSGEGFKTQRVEKVEVITSRETTVNAALEVGAESTEIFVTVPGIELNKVEPTLRLTLPGTLMDEIAMSSSSLVPLGSRNQLRFALFAPAVSRVPGQNETSANGHRGRENNYMIDGVENNDNTVTLPAIFMPPEAIREMHVQVAAYSAEFGHSIGAQINTTTKSGSNAFHGELWEFARNSALEPLSLTSRKAKLTTTPRLSDHQFGADLGGPIFKEKTFFFGIFQGNLQRQAASALTAVTIPTPAGYAALLTAALRPASGSVPAQSAASRAEILKALSFLPDFYPQVKSFTNLTSTTTVNNTPIQLGTFTPIIPQDQNVWYYGGRIDHEFTGSDRLSYRASLDHRNSPLSGGNRAFGERWAADNLTFSQNHSLSYTKIFVSNLVNEARLAYTRTDPSFPERDPVTSTTNIQSPSFTIGGASNFPQSRLEQTYQLQNVTSYIVSKHSMRFGFDLARTRLDSNNTSNSKGTWTYPTLESFLNSQPTSLVQLAYPTGRFTFHQLRQAYFFQDDIKLRPNFTVNLGLRYETASVPLGYFGATSQAEIDALVAAPGKRDTNNWGPRLGFAYSPDFSSGLLGNIFGSGLSSIRGGFGMSYDVLYYSMLSTPGGPFANFPRTNANSTTSLPADVVDLFPKLTTPVASTPVLGPTTTFVSIPSDTQNPTSHFWSLSLQRQIRQNFVFEIGYTGSRSYHLLHQGQRNPGIITAAKADAVRAGCTTPAAVTAGCENPAGFDVSPVSSASSTGRVDSRWASRTLLEASGEASYNAMYARIEKRLSNGLQFGMNYTWSANLSDSEDLLIGDLLLVGSSPANPQDFLNRRNEWGRSVLDRPHRFTVQYGYRIPGFQDQGALLRTLLSGWQISGFSEVQSGQPFTIRVGVDVLGNGLSSASAAGRPDYNPGGILMKDPATGDLRTFVIPLDGTGIVTAPHVTSATGAITFLKNSMAKGGNLGRNTFRGPGFSNSNVSLMKKFSLPHEMSLDIRGDFINVFNHDNFANPDSNMSNITNGTFGTQTIAPVTDARQVLLGAKITF